MDARTIRAKLTFLSLFAAGAALVACGGDGGGSGGAGGTGGGSASSSSSSTSSSSSSSGSTGSQCVALCGELNNCPGVTMSDCNADCPPVDTFNSTAGCASQYDAFATCVLAATDKCAAPSGDCQAASADYVMCTTDYCNANPGTTGCP